MVGNPLAIAATSRIRRLLEKVTRKNDVRARSREVLVLVQLWNYLDLDDAGERRAVWMGFARKDCKKASSERRSELVVASAATDSGMH